MKSSYAVAATLTLPEVGVCRFLARTHISWNRERAMPKINFAAFATDDSRSVMICLPFALQSGEFKSLSLSYLL